jgi:flagellar basal-body rod protein FlgB
MSATDLPLIGLLKQRMHWHQARQKVLAQNVANADSPGFQPQDLKVPADGRQGGTLAPPVALERTSALHLAGTNQRPGEAQQPARRFETTPSGNAVNLEDEMMKVAQNQSDYQLATSLYQHGLGMLKTAIGRGR